MDLSIDYLETVKTRWFRRRYGRDEFEKFLDILRAWNRKPWPLQELLQTVRGLFCRDIDLLQGFEQFIMHSYPEATAKAKAISAVGIETHRQACEGQSDSRLLTLPREIRDKIWKEVVTGNVIHISTSSDIHVKRGRSGRPKRPHWQYYSCMASKGLRSSVCPPGSGDHLNCPTSGPSNYAIIHLVCKQIHMELDSAGTFFSHNALQFADLAVAYKYLFGLREDDRASITHLRLLIPYSLMSMDHRSYHHPGKVSEWHAICNYFSNIWDRKTLDMYPLPRDKPWLLKEPIYFYYSNCYYYQNIDRMHKKWQVGRGDTSWDVDIADLKYKGALRLDLTMEMPEFEFRIDAERCLDALWDVEDFDNPKAWLKPLLQFRNNDGVTLQFCDKNGLRTKPKLEAFASALKEYMSGHLIGPRVSAFFHGRIYGNGNDPYPTGYQRW
ncbi:hypothetical protein N431DRAFT_389336 [Stipitochalara longipes BDJ]|nr:hypothetical protein N431DRAFT_389336 [Stipitochalara longipes BDJ]